MDNKEAKLYLLAFKQKLIDSAGELGEGLKAFDEGIKALDENEGLRNMIKMGIVKDCESCKAHENDTEVEQEPRKGYWLRMSDLSEQEDDRYKCSCCGNVVHYKYKMDLYTFNRWCGRCGSDNGRDIEEEVYEDRKKLWLKMYPIGATYTGKYNPQGLFGGTWEQIKESVFIRRA